MNNLNNSNLKETIISTLQELKASNPNFFLLEPFHILTWKSKKIEGALITKINGQRYLGFQRKDIKGQDYWKFKPLKSSGSEESDPESSANPPNSSDSITKYQQRLEKTQALNHGKSKNSNEQFVNDEQSQSNR
jgi:hypothetical protein